MTIATNLGFSRMGPHRELKKALERFWAKNSDAGELLATARASRTQLEAPAGRRLAQVPCNDYSLYDHVLDAALMVGVRPDRFGGVGRDSTATSRWPGAWPTRGSDPASRRMR